MKRHVYLVGIELLFCSGFLSVSAAEISPAKAVRVLEHEMDHTWVLTTQRSGLAHLVGAVEKNLISPMLDKRVKSNPAAWLPEAEIAANRKPAILLIFSEKIPTDVQLLLTSYLVDKSHRSVSTAQLEAVIADATEHAPHLVRTPPPGLTLLIPPTQTSAVASYGLAGDVIHYDQLPISEIRLPAPEVFSFGLPVHFTLYLGTARGYWNIDNVLVNQQITHTLSLVDIEATTEKPTPLPPPYEIPHDHQLHIRDLPDTSSAPLRDYFAPTTAFISAAIRQGTDQHPAHIFVHCHAGKSRSPSVIVAFLLESRAAYLQQHHQGWTAYTTEEMAYLQTLNPSAGKASATMTDFIIAMLKTSRPIVEINLGFYSQLKELEKSLQKQVDSTL